MCVFAQVAGLSVQNQMFGEAVKQPGLVFALARFDGVLGMAYPILSVGKVRPVFDSIMAGKLLQQNVFSFYINRSDFTLPSGCGQDPDQVLTCIDPDK